MRDLENDQLRTRVQGCKARRCIPAVRAPLVAFPAQRLHAGRWAAGLDGR